MGGSGDVEPEEPIENGILPIPQPKQKLPRPIPARKQIHRENSWDEESEGDGEVDRERAGELEAGWERKRASERLPLVQQSERPEESPPGPGEPVLPRRPFIFLTSMQNLSNHHNGLDGADGEDAESESGASLSDDDSVSAASVSGLSLAPRAGLLPGPWLTPSRSRLAQVMEEN